MKHGAVLVLFVAAAILAAVGILLVVHPARSGRRPAVKAPATSAPVPSGLPSVTPSASQPAPVDPGEEPDAPPSRKAPSDRSIQKGLEATWPGDLPADQQKELVAVGWAVIRADLTGQGREKWPSYFPGEASRTRYTRVRMRAGVARSVPSRADLAQVLVIWTGKDPQGHRIPQERTAVCLAQDGPRWAPRIPTDCATGQL